MIEQERFLVPSREREKWLEVRQTGVTATAVAKAVTPDGFREVLDQLRQPGEIPDNDYMRFGREQEGPIIEKLQTVVDIEPNDWLIAKDSDEKKWMMATPDGLSQDHKVIAEVKTTGRDWGRWAQVPGNYHRQVQWQLFVTGADVCVFAWMLRVNKAGEMVPGWPGPKYVEVERDETLMERLEETAHRLYAELLAIRG
ncbi:MAG: YqaJ viral recombinase family protein [Pontimonas sp.]